MQRQTRICGCGRIHFLSEAVINEALEKDMNVLFVCGGCGRATMIGADREHDWIEGSDKEIFNMYSCEAGNEDFVLDASNFENAEGRKGIYRVVYSAGKRVRMETGMYATHFDHGKFSDTWYPDFWKIERNDITVAEVMKFIEKWNKDRFTVRMRDLLQELSDEEAEQLSKCWYIKNLDWSGTKYQRKE